MIPFFALVTPDHELPPVWFPTNTIKFIPIPTFIFEAPLLLVISCPLNDLLTQFLSPTATVKGKTRKLSPSWKGPGVVIEKLTPYVRCSPDSRTLVPQAAQSPYPTSSYWVCTLCFYLQRTLVPYSLIRGGILSPLCSGKCANCFIYINQELRLIVPRRRCLLILVTLHTPFHISRHIFTYPPPIIPRLHFLDCPFYAILMMVDQFTKWVECIPLPSQSAEETARAAVNQFFSRFGLPCSSIYRGP
jgi:hypothetical protein